MNVANTIGRRHNKKLKNKGVGKGDCLKPASYTCIAFIVSFFCGWALILGGFKQSNRKIKYKMKKYMEKARQASVAVLICAAIIMVASCHKNAFTSGTPTGTFYFRLYTNVYTNQADSVAPYYYFDSMGRYLSLQIPQFFISGIVLKTTGGGTVPMTNVYILKDLDTVVYVIGSAPEGTYNSVTFTVGFDASANGEPPYEFIPNGPTPSATMYYNDTVGYMAMKVVGLYDTTSTSGHIGSGLNPINFSFNIPNILAQSVTLPYRGTTGYPVYTLATGGTAYIDVVCDYGRLLSVLNLKTQNNSDGMTVRPGIADTLATEIPYMFYYKD